jgi:hypothetical protein
MRSIGILFSGICYLMHPGIRRCRSMSSTAGHSHTVSLTNAERSETWLAVIPPAGARGSLLRTVRNATVKRTAGCAAIDRRLFVLSIGR